MTPERPARCPITTCDDAAKRAKPRGYLFPASLIRPKQVCGAGFSGLVPSMAFSGSLVAAFSGSLAGSGVSVTATTTSSPPPEALVAEAVSSFVDSWSTDPRSRATVSDSVTAGLPGSVLWLLMLLLEGPERSSGGSVLVSSMKSRDSTGGCTSAAGCAGLAGAIRLSPAFSGRPKRLRRCGSIFGHASTKMARMTKILGKTHCEYSPPHQSLVRRPCELKHGSIVDSRSLLSPRKFERSMASEQMPSVLAMLGGSTALNVQGTLFMHSHRSQRGPSSQAG
mmetsp:Transcript_81365/g.143598  ORF Transcript_81365/g.143598 Transcript_81365/m.143598 type:complete len:281 (+) Transcript_81365:2529-3371(+)